MDFNDVQCAVRSLRRPINQMMEGLFACGPEFWQLQPDGYFGPGEEMIHIAQVATFTRYFAAQQLDFSANRNLRPFVMPPELAACIDDPARLDDANLRGARSRLESLGTFDDFRTYVLTRCQAAHTWVEQLPQHLAARELTHPLVDIRCRAAIMLHRQLVYHTVYHLGQAITLFKVHGHIEHAPHLEMWGLPAKQAA